MDSPDRLAGSWADRAFERCSRRVNVERLERIVEHGLEPLAEGESPGPLVLLNEEPEKRLDPPTSRTQCMHPDSSDEETQE